MTAVLRYLGRMASCSCTEWKQTFKRYRQSLV